jgi:hypothetical protein
MSAIAKTNFLASVDNAHPDDKPVRRRSPALLIVLSGQQDHGGLICALDGGALPLALQEG